MKKTNRLSKFLKRTFAIVFFLLVFGVGKYYAEYYYLDSNKTICNIFRAIELFGFVASIITAIIIDLERKE